MENRGRLYFEYDPEFLQDPLWLSPFKLPPEPGLLEHRDRDFGPIFGLFDDSLPDGWGLLLMDRFFRQRSIDPRTVSVLDRLAYLGSRTMGALTYRPPTHGLDRDLQLLDLHELAQASDQVLRGTTDEVLPQLLRAGGSPGGARPKVLVGVRGDEIISGEDELPSGFSHWIVKFSGQGDPEDAGAIELAYAHMAKDAGIDMPSIRAFDTPQGQRFFGVERFDRQDDQRFHVHTFGNLIHANFRIPSCDYQQLLHTIRVLTRDHRAVLEGFRRMAFNVATHNRDDHAKNFAFKMTHGGQWQLAPAYDLMVADGPGGEHTMTVAGEGRDPGRRELLAVAESAELSSQEVEPILEEVTEVVGRWRRYGEDAGVGRRSLDWVESRLRST